jgi:flagellar hook-associated protein 1 FlgK
MTNFGAKILGNSTSAMTAQQALLANASNNIANVNTPGYTRRDISIQTQLDPAVVDGYLSIGSGVKLGDIQRLTNAFLESSTRTALSKQGKADAKSDYLSRIENLFAFTGPQNTIGSAMNEFFSSVNQLSLNPSSLDQRLNVLQRGQDLVSSITATYNDIARAQDELNSRLPQEIESINKYTEEIAHLNGVISTRETVGLTAADERDHRDTILAQLAGKVSFTTLESPNGMINCTLDNGFPLVNQSTARALKVTTTPSFAPPAGLPNSLSGGVLSYVVYDYGTANAPMDLDLTKVLKNGQGSLGGILQVRGYADPSNTSPFQADGELVGLAARVEMVARQLLTGVNQVYRGSDEAPLVAGTQGSSGDLNGNTPGVFGLFDFNYSGAKDADGDGLATGGDLSASGIGVFSRVLKLGFSSPDEFAAALDTNQLSGLTSFSSGDGRNAQALADLRSSKFTFSVDSNSFQGTFDELYNSIVSTVGTLSSAAKVEADVAKASYQAAVSKRDEFSAVSLDEEFANVIKYQKAFQASARMIKTAGELLDTIVSLI